MQCLLFRNAAAQSRPGVKLLVNMQSRVVCFYSSIINSSINNPPNKPSFDQQAMITMASTVSLCCLLFLFPLISLAVNPSDNIGGGRFRYLHEECKLEQIAGLQPRHRVESEGGISEYFDGNEPQLRCAGVTFIRRTLYPGGLFLPDFSNIPGLVYVLQGSGIASMIVTGCPESFQSFEQQQQQGKKKQAFFSDQHQKIYDFRQGDIIASPAGTVHWHYNNGDQPLVTVAVLDISSTANQLDSTPRQFMLAGSHRTQQQGDINRHLFRAFDTKLLASALGVPEELAAKIQREDSRGEMVMVKEGTLKLIHPHTTKYSQIREADLDQNNRLDEPQQLCWYRLRENIDNPQEADYFNPEAGWMAKLSGKKLPILRRMKLNARRGVMKPRATMTPRWVVNAHDIVYVTKGSARVEIAGDDGRAVHDGEIKEGQLLVIPQNFVAVVRAGEEGFEWVAFETNDDAIDNKMVGKMSVLKGMPVDVIANAYRISTEEAFKIKFGRKDEMEMFGGDQKQQQMAGRAVE